MNEIAKRLEALDICADMRVLEYSVRQKTTSVTLLYTPIVMSDDINHVLNITIDISNNTGDIVQSLRAACQQIAFLMLLGATFSNVERYEL